MKKIFLTAMKTSISEVMETMFFLPIEFGQESILSQSGMDKKKYYDLPADIHRGCFRERVSFGSRKPCGGNG